MNATLPERPGLNAVILAGGRAQRLDGASKPDLIVGGRRLLETTIEAARSAGCERIAIVGPPSLEAPDCLIVREAPPFGGPVAGLAAGLAALASDAAPAAPRAEVLVLACDMPDAPDAVARLLAARASGRGADGVCLIDASGHRQWLAAVYSHRALERALDGLGWNVGGVAMRRLTACLDLAVVVDGGSTHDIDTWGDLAQVRSARKETAR